jgi:hypothetical protein
VLNLVVGFSELEGRLQETYLTVIVADPAQSTLGIPEY